ncbi:MAG: LytR C-terminal domain-containing protein [Acidimicrobiales bacterium]
MKGLILVAIAVLLGAALLLKSFDDGGPFKTSTSKPGATATSTTVAGQQATSTTLSVAKNPAEVKVLVLNGIDKTKPIASTAAAALKSANYTTLAPGDAAATVKTSAIYFVAGFEPDARLVAAKLGIPETAVAALPSPLPASVDDAKEANVVAVVGPDAGVIGGATTPSTPTTAAN